MATDWNDEAVAGLPIAQGRAELLEEIMSTSTDTDDLSDRRARLDRHDSRRRWVVPAVAAAAVAVLAVVATVPLWGSGDDSTAPATPPASTPAVPEAPADQLVFADSGWRIGPSTVNDVEQEVSYDFGPADSELGVDIKRIPAEPGLTLDQIADEHRDVTSPPSDGNPLEVAGLAARWWSYSAEDRVVATEAVAGYRYEVRATGMSDAAFGRLLDEMDLVDQAAFEASLPDDFVLPTENADATARILDDIEDVSGAGMPAGVADPSSSEMDYRQFALDVAGQYACAWFDQYAAAYIPENAEGTEAASESRAESRRVLGTARDWPVLVELGSGDGYVDELWKFADRAAAGRPVRDVGDALGC